MQIEYIGYGSCTGYGTAAKDYALALAQAGADVAFRPMDANISRWFDPKDRVALKKLRNNELTSKDVVQVFHCIPDSQRRFRYKRRNKTVGFATFEANKAPNHWSKYLKANDLVVVPSQFCHETFDNKGFNLVNIPHCLNTEYWHPRKRTKNNQYTFMAIGSWRRRKGWLELSQAWEGMDDCHLKIVTDNISKARDKFGSFKNVSVHTKIEDMAQFMSTADCIVCPTLGEGFGYCLHPESEVKTPLNNKTIKELKIGDFVLDINGKSTIVINHTHKLHNGLLYNFKGQGVNLNVTPEHEIFIHNRGWVKAENVNKNDKLIMPVPNLPKKISSLIDLSELIKDKKVHFDEKYIWHENGYSPNQKYSITKLCNMFNATKKQVEKARELNRGKRKNVRSEKVLKISSFLKTIPIITPEKYPRYIHIDEDTMNLFGWYIAEGSNNGKYLELSCGINDRPYINKLKQTLLKLGLTVNEIAFNNTIRVVASGLPVRLFDIFGKGAKNKKIPNEFMSTDPLVLQLINGYILGDGNIRKDRYHIRASSVSYDLISQLSILLQANEIWNKIIKTDKEKIKGKKANYDIYEINILGNFALKLGTLIKHKWDFKPQRKTHSKVKIIDNNFIIPIKNIQTYSYNGLVYDITVESDSHAFISDNCIVHNCGLQALALELPLICTDYSGVKEYANKDTCCLIPVEEMEVKSMMDNLFQFKGCEWPVISPAVLRSKMQEVQKNHDFYQKKAQRGCVLVRDMLSYGRVGNSFRQAIEGIE